MRPVYVGLLLSPLMATAQTPESTSNRLEEVVVSGKLIEHYLATDALTGTKTGAALRDLPLSINVISRELIEDRRLTSLSESLDNVPGVQRKLGYGGTQNFGAFIRGFDTGVITFRNGFRDFGFYTLRDVANVERFEVLKGPASILYGTLQPGGITHTLTKRPLATAFNRVTAVTGSDDFHRAELDSGGALAEQVFYRLNAAYEDAGSYRDLVDSRAEFFAPVVTWKLSESTHWTFEAEYKHTEFVWDLGLPKNAVVLRAPINRFLGEVDKKNDVTSVLVSSVLEHRFNDTWRLRQNASYAYSGGDYAIRSPLPTINGTSVNRGAYDSPSHSGNLNLQHELIGNIELAGMRHEGVFGVDLYRNRDTYDFNARSIGPIDLFEPVYGGPLGDPVPAFGNQITSDAVGVYVQDLIALRHNVKLLAGARWDHIRYRNVDRITDALVRRATDTAVSPQLGIVVQPSESTSLYGSYSTSFVPVTSGVKADGSYLDPEKGKQYEIGAKQDFLDNRANATLAVFWITKQNVSQADPANPPFRIQIGEQKSRGAEVSVSGTLLPGWSIVAGGAYIDAYISRATTLRVGTPLENVPTWSGNLWTTYRASLGAWRGLMVGGGIYYADKRQVSSFNGPPIFFMPSYTRVDAMAGYEREHWSVQLNLKNLTDDVIYDLAGTSLMPQQPRSWLLSASYTF